MASEEMGLVPAQRVDNGLNSQLVFQDEGLRFGCGLPQHRVGDPGPKTRELSGFIDNRYFQPQPPAEFRRSMYGEERRHGHHQENQNWNGNGRTSTTPSGEGSEGDEEEDDDEDEDDEDDEGEGGALIGVEDNNLRHKNNDCNNTDEQSNTDTIGNGKSKHLSSFVGSKLSNRGVMMKEANILQSGSDNSNTRAIPNDGHQHQGRVHQYQSAVTIAGPDGDLYYSQYLQGAEGSDGGHKDLVIENGCGFSGRKESSYSSESGESLKMILSDPLTGAIMDDAMILPCGHSFGGGGVQHVIRMKACYTCSRPVSEESISPNLSLRAAVQAFRREEELLVCRSSKRRRDRIEQDKVSFGDSTSMDHPRGRGVQFPFAVTDRVIIKGNKRTPQRFVGREAIVTTQCLNGWYVVKTLDNAESVKLQYRSLAKVPDNHPPSSNPAPSKMTATWALGLQ